jgi:hypothetical protein
MTDYLFSQPSAISGAGRILDLMGEFDRYNRSDSPAEADARALFSDVMAVGGDFLKVMEAHPLAGPGAKE